MLYEIKFCGFELKHIKTIIFSADVGRFVASKTVTAIDFHNLIKLYTIIAN